MKTIKPYLAGLAVVCIWSGWLTLSRYGVHSRLQPADITLLRYWTAFLVVSPLALRYPWQQFRLHQYLVIGLGVGFPYTMLSFYGLKVLRAAHGGVLVNGMLPVLGALVAWRLFRQRLATHRYAAIALIFFSNGIMTGDSAFSISQSIGIVLLLTAAVCYTLHMTGIRLWRMGWRDVVVIVPVVNIVLFTPLWLALPVNHDPGLLARYSRSGHLSRRHRQCPCPDVRGLCHSPIGHHHRGLVHVPGAGDYGPARLGLPG